MNSESSIDRIRESAGSMTIGDTSDGIVTGVITIADRLYVVKQKAIYRVAFADEIDPQRTRADIPNTQQIIVNAGSESYIVRKILLTAEELFRKDRLLSGIDFDAARLTSLEILKDVIAANEVAEIYKNAKIAAESEVSSSKDMSFKLPAIPDIEARAKTFIQKCDHAFQAIYKLCCVFYNEAEMRNAGKWLDGFVVILKSRLEADDPFIEFASVLAGTGKHVRDVRHCIEHPKENQRIIVQDYSLTLSRELAEPTIEVVHKTSSFPPEPLGAFFELMIGQMLDGVELLMAYLASRNISPPGNLPVYVGEIPENQQRNGVRFGYLISMGDNVSRLG
ncbi:hypothetical protein [Rhizobium sp. CF142]|uniref:hypothetical protein n=1 Tax=Rhizobium sp. CF142 TaxID=1144314 RepID=UPI00026F0374|nr:hypothetical protein [Rhizobium sp. CF142]EJJ25013.1 hypothetical protein PMI11_06773 [Rhizobium sp. CF142]